MGLQDARAAGLITRADRIETVDARDQAANIDAFVQDNYDILITVGYSMSESTREAAQTHPSIYFIGIEQPQDDTKKNLVGLVFHEDRSGYLAGTLAAMMSQTGRVAAICEERFIDQMRRYCEGFQAGAQGITSVQAAVVFREGSADLLFRDTGWGSAAATNALDQGADVIFAAGGETATAALSTAAKEGALVIGTETDQFNAVPAAQSRMLSSAVSKVRQGVLQLIRLRAEGTPPAGKYFGEVGLASFHDLDGLIGQDVRSRLAAIESGLALGSISTGVPYLTP